MAHNYSTSEQEVGTWVDGSKVYEKTYVIDSPTRNGSWQVIEQLNPSLIVSYKCANCYSSGEYGTQDTTVGSEANYPRIIRDTSGNVKYLIISSVGISKFYLILRYLK